MNMPAIKPLVMDPYTYWKSSKGEAVETMYHGAGNTNDPNAKTAFTSGYGRNNLKLGAGFDFDNTPVMKVATNYSSYWRGESLAYYTGEGWVESKQEMNAAYDIVDLNRKLNTIGADLSVETRKLTATVTMLQEPAPILFVAFPITRMTDVGTATNPNHLHWEPMNATMNFTGKSEYPMKYSFESDIPLVNEEKLRQLTRAPQANNRNYQQYLQIPQTMPSRVGALAKQITAGHTNDYDRLQALVAYLKTSRQFTYTNHPDLSLKQSEDFVDSFLFEMKQGYCDYFSSALIMMARSLDIPARWVKGFASGSKDFSLSNLVHTPRDAAQGTDAGTYVVRNSDAHSWAEIYIDGFGWLTVEATPGFEAPQAAAEEEQKTAAPEQTTKPEEEEKQAEASKAEQAAQKRQANVSHTWMYAVLSIIGGLLIILLLIYILLRRTLGYRLYRLGKLADADQKLIVLTEYWINLCRRKGLVREPYETLRESTNRWTQEREELQGLWDQLLPLFEKTTYSGGSISEEEWTLAQEELVKLDETLSLHRKNHLSTDKKFTSI